MGYENCGKHPNSLKQLKPYMDSDKAREIRDEIITEMPTAVDILKVQLVKAMQIEDQDTIERLAIALAEYEQPKLQRVDQTTRNLDTSELSEEELDARIQELTNISP